MSNCTMNSYEMKRDIKILSYRNKRMVRNRDMRKI